MIDKIKGIIMQKLMIVKAISILMGICIIACMMSIVFFIAKGVPSKKQAEQVNQIIDLPKVMNGKIENFTLENGNIYIQISSRNKDEIIVINEKSGKNILSIKLEKGADND